MKRKVLVIILVGVFLLTGCSKESESNILKKLANKIDKASAYHAQGELEIISNEEKYLYDVNVSYEKEEKFRVSLKNQTNNHEQVILRNEEGVYVLTPSLNKSFKFQSEWPYNNSQTYLLGNLVDDIKKDKKRTFKKEKDGYIFTVNANYSNNKELIKQNIYVSKKHTITKVEVLNSKNQIKMTMKIQKMDLKSNYKKNYFTLKENMSVSVSKTKEVNKIEDIVYPMYLPEGTKLASQDRVKKDSGERVILTFEGKKPFTIVEETVTSEKNSSIIPVSGEMEIITDVVGSVTENSISFISNNIEYYITSSKLTKNEMIDIANSISVLPVSK
jgi:hypothetical protein